MKLADKILKLRKQAGLSQEELAERLNVSRQAISRWEVGSAMPDASNVQQLSKLFGVTADYLLNDDYESDQDVPAVKSTSDEGNQKMQRMVVRGKTVIALGVSAFGLFANGLIYLLSRIIEVYMPRYSDPLGMYESVSDHSYYYFIEEYDLELIAVLSWAMVLCGLIYVILRSEKGQKAVAKVRAAWRVWRQKKNGGTDGEGEE